MYKTINYFSVYKRKVHNIGKPIDEVTPRGPNHKLRKRYQQSQNMEEEFDKMASTPARKKRKKRKLSEEDDTDEEDLDLDDEDFDNMDLENENDEEKGTKTIQVGDKNFTFSFA